MKNKKIRVIMVEDQPVYLEAIKFQLAPRSDIEWAGEADDGLSGLELIKKVKPDIAIIDYYVKNLYGIHFIKKIKSLEINVKIITLTLEDNPFLLLRMIESGSDSVLTKSHHHAFPDIIQAVASNKNILQDTSGYAVVQAALERQVLLKLNEKERLYFESSGQKKDHAAIAAELGMQPNSVKKLLTSTKKKMGVTDKEELIALYHKFFPDKSEEA